MNISCSRCLKPFSITAEQLGTRGKCPHCRATIILPRSAPTGMHYEDHEIDRPAYWTQSLFCLVATFFLHASVMAVMAMMPWGEIADDQPGDGTLVMIGKLPHSVVLDRNQEEFDAEEMLNPEDQLLSENFDSELFSPRDSGELSEQMLQESFFSPSSGGKKTFEFESLNSSTVPAGGSEDFEGLISRLRKDGLDIIITFDSTGSMQGEIDQVKSRISRIGSVLFSLIEKSRIGICTYRDHGDAYVVDGLPMTDNLAEVVLFLEKITASGGGDEPEAVEEGIRWATSQPFRRSARKVILLFGDAPPRPDEIVSCQQMAADFRRQGGIISTVTCRNSRRLDAFVSIADLGGGESFLTTHEREIVTQLLVLVFGSQHRDKVLQAFDLLDEAP
jgi:DNA-directed RNA polymerase subunit RPC12/RpoP